MTISKELYLAILSMDAYNRGYGAGIADGGKADTDGLGEAGSQIGQATVKAVDLPIGAQAAGFYAVAYDDPTYGTIISYRGTDNPSIYASDVSGGADITLGWVAGVGNPTDQTTMAINFFTAVAGSYGTIQGVNAASAWKGAA
jgi:hypothetical protein